MPFGNMSGDPEQKYFADGMVEDIITLSRIRWLFVIARASSFTYKGQAIDVTAREVRALPQTSGTYSREEQAMISPISLRAVATVLGVFWLLTDTASAQQTPRYPLDDKLANEPAPWAAPGKWGKRGNWGRWGEEDKRGMLNYITPGPQPLPIGLAQR